MWDVVLGVLAILVGASLGFSGLRYFFIALPILAFVVGFVVGGAAFQSLFGDGIFSTLTSWVTGFVVGLVVAAISYLWWSIVVGVLAVVGILSQLNAISSIALQDEKWTTAHSI